MPSEFTFNRTAVLDNQIEYAWEADVDTNSNGQSELKLGIFHFKFPGSTETKSNDVIGFTQHTLWRVQNDISASIGTVDVSLAGNTFTFAVDGSLAPELSDVTSVDQSIWKTYYRFDGGTQVCMDEWP